LGLEPHLIFQQEQRQLHLRFLFSQTLLELLQLVLLLTLQLEELHQQPLPTTLFHLEETATLALTKASNRIVGVTTGTSTVLTCPEGTQLPFGVGDYVTLSGSTYHNFTSAEVLSVDTSSGVEGLFQTRMTVNYNSSGIIDCI
jgi:hypothetical protein